MPPGTHHGHRSISAYLVVIVCTLTLLPSAHAQAKIPLADRLPLCSGCHNTDGNSVIPDYPKLAGLHAEYLHKQLTDIKRGTRKSEVMNGIIGTVDESEFEALAEYFSEQKPLCGTALDANLAAQGKAIFDDGIVGSAVPACSGCHNEDGSGTNKYPRVAGQHAAYVVQQLLNFKNGHRNNDTKAVMRAVVTRMNDKEIRAVAEYITTLKGE